MHTPVRCPCLNCSRRRHRIRHTRSWWPRLARGCHKDAHPFFFKLWHPLSDVLWLPTNRHRLPTNRHRRAYWTLQVFFFFIWHPLRLARCTLPHPKADHFVLQVNGMLNKLLGINTEVVEKSSFLTKNAVGLIEEKERMETLGTNIETKLQYFEKVDALAREINTAQMDPYSDRFKEVMGRA